MWTRRERAPAPAVAAAACMMTLLGCAGSATQREARSVADAPEIRARVEPTTRPGAGPSDAELAGPLVRDVLLRAAVARSPALRARALRVRSLVAGARAAGALPPPMAMATLWEAPLRSPFLYGEEAMLMLGVQQTFTPSGARDGEARAALEEARAETARLAAGERELVLQVEQAFVVYRASLQKERLFGEQRALLGQLVDVARARLSTGGTALSDVTKAELDVARLEGELAAVRGERARAVAALNALLRRAPGSALGAPADEDPSEPGAPLDEVAALASARRPELAAARATVRREAARSEAAEAMATQPMITVGVNYGLRRQSGMPDTWGATLATTLPWLSPGSRAQAEAASLARASASAETDAAGVDVVREVGEAYSMAESAARRYAVLEARTYPATARAIEAARAAYVGGPGDALAWLDALRVRLEVALARIEARAELDRALATLDRAAGTTVPRKTLNLGEPGHVG